MPISFKEKISQHFGKAHSYDQVAYIQKDAARLLAKTLQKQLQNPRAILEIGCGTGFLSEMILEAFPDACSYFTDLSPEMITRTKEKIKAHPPFLQKNAHKHALPNIFFEVMDGENPAPHLPRDFDLITSNLCIQWFTNHAYAFEKLSQHLAPKGKIVMTTLLQGSLKEWRISCEKFGLSCGVPLYPTAQEMQNSWDSIGHGSWEGLILKEKILSARSFLRNLQKIGASLSQKNHIPVTQSQLKQAMAYFDTHYDHVTYHIGLGIFEKAPSL